MIEFLLVIIAIVELIRLGLLFKPTSKKGYFKSKIKGVDQALLDLNFKLFKTREIRENVRRDRDDSKIKLDALETEIEKSVLTLGLTKEDHDATKAEYKADSTKVLANLFDVKLTAKGVERPKIDEFKRLVDQVALILRDIKRFEDQIDMTDREINGVKTGAEGPGNPGITDYIDSNIELKVMLKEYLQQV